MPAKYLLGLKCADGCQREYTLLPTNTCDWDFGPLSVKYDYGAIARDVSRQKIQGREPTMWRYIEFLPIDADQKPATSLDTGYTPLLRANNLARALGVNELYIKNDTVNPTNSFKDRVVEMAVAKAIEFGYDSIACVSTGNLANAVSAHAARAGLRAYVLIPDTLEEEKIIAIGAFGPNLIRISGAYDQVNRLGSEIVDAHPEMPFANVNLRAYYGEGSKPMGYEIAEQLGWRAPAHIVVPVAGASLITKVHKALHEFHRVGLIDEPRTRMYAAQGAGCAPVSNAYLNNRRNIQPIPPNQITGIAKSLAIGNPADGDLALKVIRETRGGAGIATDDEIMQGIEMLATTEGVWGETAAGVTVAVAKKLIDLGIIPRNDGSIVLLITGHGYKTPNATPRKDLLPPIGPRLGEFNDILQTLEQRVEPA